MGRQALPDPNHNVKNACYQMIGGSCAACLGQYVVDMGLLFMSGVAQELYRPQDYASDAVVLCLCSHSFMKKIIKYGSPDTGNAAVTIATLLMMLMRVYAVNTRKLSWKTWAAMTLMSMLWFLFFHASDNTDNPHAMLPNKRHMLLETIALLLLVSRSDLLQSTG